MERFIGIKKEWEEFANIDQNIKEIIVEAVRDTSSTIPELRYYKMTLEKYIKTIAETLPTPSEELPF